MCLGIYGPRHSKCRGKRKCTIYFIHIIWQQFVIFTITFSELPFVCMSKWNLNYAYELSLSCCVHTCVWVFKSGLQWGGIVAVCAVHHQTGPHVVLIIESVWWPHYI